MSTSLAPRRSALAAAYLSVAVFLLASVSNACAVTITYDLVNYPSDQNGWTLSGFITTDGTIGAITRADILSWSFTATGPYVASPIFGRSSDEGSNDGPVGVVATPQSLILDGAELGLVDPSSNSPPGSTGVLDWENNITWPLTEYSLDSNSTGYAWYSDETPSSSFALNGYKIATTQPTPEPSTLALRPRHC